MRLPLRRPAPATLALSPQVPLQPTENVTATVTVAEAIDGVTAARCELGYVNRYSYRWAGRKGAALRADDTSIATIGMVGTDYGSDRNTEDWVAVLDEPLPVTGGTLAAGSHAVSLRLPSWSPGSSESTVRWAVRLRVERSGRDVELEQTLRVLAPLPDPPPRDLPIERVTGNASDIDLVTEHPAYHAGDTIRGTVTITPHAEVPKGDVAVFLQRVRTSHPLERTPGGDQELDGSRVQLDKSAVLPAGVATALPFAIEIPADADPTTESVHGSITWFVQVRILYAGFSGNLPERVRRAVVIGTRA